MNIDYKDIRVDPIWNGSNWFPQYNGVRVTHIPSGISAECTEGRSQHRNRFDAMEKLKEALKDWVEPVGDTVAISDAAKILTQIDFEREKLDKESMSLTEEINHILSEAFDKVKSLGKKQEQLIQRRIDLEQTALNTIKATLEK